MSGERVRRVALAAYSVAADVRTVRLTTGTGNMWLRDQPHCAMGHVASRAGAEPGTSFWGLVAPGYGCIPPGIDATRLGEAVGDVMEANDNGGRYVLCDALDVLGDYLSYTAMAAEDEES